MVVLMCGLCAHMWMLPFAHNDLNHLETASLMTAMFTITVAWYIRAVTVTVNAEVEVHLASVIALTLNLLLGNAF